MIEESAAGVRDVGTVEKDKVAEVESDTGSSGSGVVDQAGQVAQLLDEVEDRHHRGSIFGIEQLDQVLAGNLVAGEIRKQWYALVQEAIRTDEPVERFEDIVDLIEDRTGEARHERAEIQRHVRQNYLWRRNVESRAGRCAQAEIDKQIGGNRRQDVAETGSKGAEIYLALRV